MQETVFISTDFVDPGQKADLWREISQPLFDTTQWRDEPGDPIEGSVSMRRVGTLITASIAFNRQHYVRDRSVIVKSGLDHYVIQVVVAGSLNGDFGGRSTVAGPGDILVIDLAKPLQNRVEAGSRITFVVPREPIEKALGGRNLHGQVLRKEWPITTLLRNYLEGLHQTSANLSEPQADAAQDAMKVLLIAAMNGEDIEGAVDQSALGGALRERILAFIDLNIANQELTPELIMRRFKVSRAHLYRTFSSDGGIASLLRDKRLDAAFAELTRADASSVQIAAVAHRLGFSSGNQLLRGFRARFGVTPSQARAENLGKPGPTASAEELQAYYAALRDRTVSS